MLLVASAWCPLATLKRHRASDNINSVLMPNGTLKVYMVAVGFLSGTHAVEFYSSEKLFLPSETFAVWCSTLVVTSHTVSCQSLENARLQRL